MKQKRTQEALQDALEYAEGIVESAREPLIVLDADLRVITANTSFYQPFKTSAAMSRRSEFMISATASGTSRR